MKPKDYALAAALHAGLQSFHQNHRQLPGIQLAANLETLIEQIIESIHRVNYIARISERDISPLRAEPSSELFDPERGAIFKQRQGEIDEAFWLIFLSVYFGKHRRGMWRYVQEVYGQLGEGYWNWENISADPQAFSIWINEHKHVLRRPGAGFGNHRKYESLNNTANAIESYINWIGPAKSHEAKLAQAISEVGDDPRALFNYLYRSMDAVKSFGRTAKFDYLTMIGKTHLAIIEPGSAYMQKATGPLQGARLLFGGNINADINSRSLDQWLVELGDEIDVGMQVLEDSLCNWQKTPDRFVPFRG